MALTKLRLSDHQLHNQTGRQTRSKTPQNLRVCKKCPEYIEDEAHFLTQCSEDSDIKTDLVHRIAIDFQKISGTFSVICLQRIILNYWKAYGKHISCAFWVGELSSQRRVSHRVCTLYQMSLRRSLLHQVAPHDFFILILQIYHERHPHFLGLYWHVLYR